jgi:GntR family transcriptional regulator
VFSLHPESGVPIYRQLMDQIRRLVTGGHLPPGAELPSVRDLAAQHAVNPMTVSKAYALLEAEGLLSRNRGKPMTVTGAGKGAAPLALRLAQLEPQATQLAAAARQLEVSLKDTTALVKRQWESDEE